MTDVTQILSDIENGDPRAAEQLLPLVYAELRKLAGAKLANEKPGQTLQATALVHEAYARLVVRTTPQQWNGRGHFFASAAEAMRRILVERARAKSSKKRGGGLERLELDGAAMVTNDRDERIVALDEALSRLEERDAVKAELVRLRFFAGLTNAETAQILGISESTADRYWAYSRAWLKREMTDQPDSPQ